MRGFTVRLIWNIHSPKIYSAKEDLCFLFASWWRLSCYLIDHNRRDLTTSILMFYSQKLGLLCRSLNFTWFHVKTGFQEDLDYFLPFLKRLFSFQCEYSCPFEILSSMFFVFCVLVSSSMFDHVSHIFLCIVLSCFQLRPVSCCLARNLPSAE